MKYKCFKPFHYYDVTVANTDDIISISENEITNITTGVTFNKRDIPVKYLKDKLEAIVDEGNDATQEIPVYADDFKNITQKMHETYLKKNHDYGNSFDKSLDKFGLVASTVRLGDKMNRIESLTSKIALVNDESIKDTLLDLANYAIMTVMWLNKNGNVKDLQKNVINVLKLKR